MGMTIAFDPGKMTGIALLQETEGSAPHFDSFALPYEQAMTWVDEWFDGGSIRPTDQIVCEAIVINSQTHKKSSEVLMSVEQIGILRFLCRKWGVPFKTQTAGEAKSFSTDHKLKAMDWWYTGLDHPRDAARHLMLWKANTDSQFLTDLAARSLS